MQRCVIRCCAQLRRMQVYANDLNPRSHHYLDINVKLNKVCLSSLCRYRTTYSSAEAEAVGCHVNAALPDTVSISNC